MWRSLVSEISQISASLDRTKDWKKHFVLLQGHKRLFIAVSQFYTIQTWTDSYGFLRHFKHANNGYTMPSSSLKFISKNNGIYK